MISLSIDKIAMAILYNAAPQLRKKESFHYPTSSAELGFFHNMELFLQNVRFVNLAVPLKDFHFIAPPCSGDPAQS